MIYLIASNSRITVFVIISCGLSSGYHLHRTNYTSSSTLGKWKLTSKILKPSSHIKTLFKINHRSCISQPMIVDRYDQHPKLGHNWIISQFHKISSHNPPDSPTGKSNTGNGWSLLEEQLTMWSLLEEQLTMWPMTKLYTILTNGTSQLDNIK